MASPAQNHKLLCTAMADINHLLKENEELKDEVARLRAELSKYKPHVESGTPHVGFTSHNAC